MRKTILLIMSICIGIGIASVPKTLSASNVPDTVRDSITEELVNWEQQWNLLSEQSSSQDVQTNAVSNKDAANLQASTLTLGEGYLQYVIWTEDLLNIEKDHPIRSEEVLRWTGYMFDIKSSDGRKGVVFADPHPDSHKVTLTQMSTDANFTEEMRRARESIGDDQDSKLIYDGANQMVGLVFTQNEVEQVMLLKDSMLNDMKQFEKLSFAKFIGKIRDVQEERLRMAASFDEPVYGAAAGMNELVSTQPQNKFSGWNVIFLIMAIGMVASIIAVLKYKRRTK